MESFITLGKKIYHIEKSREARRMVVFVARCLLNRGRMERLDKWFHQSELLSEIAEIYPFVYEQPTRAFFYNKSCFDERAKLVEEHMSFLTEKLKADTVKDIYRENDQILWEYPKDKLLEGIEEGTELYELFSQPLRLVIYFEPGQRKEGMLSVILRLGETPLYQMIFWIAKNKDEEWSLWIGAMQGPNLDDSRELIKKLTKKCHGFRTKNLILYATQAVARALDLKHIYAVTNYGYYANNHVRMDRKLKTSFSDFWAEAGGHATEDNRFDELPLVEPRKSIEEAPTRKRAVYRRRFQLLDEIDEAIEKSMKGLMK